MLKPIQHTQIEMVRQWRNTPRIRSLMLDSSEISTEQQVAWFERVWASEQQLYMLIYFKQKPIGVTSLTAIDKVTGCCEPGMYIYDQQYQGNIIPFCAAFALNDVAFEQFGLTQLRGKIFESNQASMRFHKACGYQVTNQQEDLVYLTLNQTDYQIARDRMKRFMRFDTAHLTED